MKKNPTSDRVYRDLTADERQRLDVARTETEANQDQLLAEGRIRKLAWTAMRREVERTIAKGGTRTGRIVAGGCRSGLKRSSLSRLEAIKRTGNECR